MIKDSRLKKDFGAQSGEFKIFVDLDGVLADFDSHAKAQGKYNDKGQLNWDGLDLAWWASMPVFEGAKDFFDTLRKYGPTRILTAPILNPDCFRGKAEWVMNFRGSRFGLLDLVICRAENKNLLARPNNILVDDRQKNVDQWIAAGGIGILHTGNFADTLKRVEEAMESYRLAPPLPAPCADDGKTEIFIGPNGVLADFAGHAKAHDKFTPDGKTKWDELDMDWWKSMPAYDGAKAFFDAMREEGLAVRLLTGPVPNPDGFEGPAQWIMKFRPESGKFALLDLIICRSKDKALLARPNKILIDDRRENIDQWVAAGGIGILHAGDFGQTLKEVRGVVAKLAPAQKQDKAFKPKI